MRKIFVTIYFGIICVCSQAQRSIEGLIKAEKSFAAYSVANGTKDAFLKFADSAGIVFDQGKPGNATEYWNKRQKGPGKLNWHPEYAEIAASNDFGYTTGPWNFVLRDTVRATGYFISVWHINNKKQWRFLIDLGINQSATDTADESTISIVQKELNPTLSRSDQQSLVQTEEKFIADYRELGKAAYKKYLSAFSRMNRNRSLPAVNQQWQQQLIDSTPVEIKYEQIGSGISSTVDLGYVYGTATINGKQDGYLRIWRRESDGWKIALEVLRY
jgi:hypothetical protein